MSYFSLAIGIIIWYKKSFIVIIYKFLMFKINVGKNTWIHKSIILDDGQRNISDQNNSGQLGRHILNAVKIYIFQNFLNIRSWDIIDVDWQHYRLGIWHSWLNILRGIPLDIWLKRRIQIFVHDHRYDFGETVSSTGGYFSSVYEKNTIDHKWNSIHGKHCPNADFLTYSLHIRESFLQRIKYTKKYSRSIY